MTVYDVAAIVIMLGTVGVLFIAAAVVEVTLIRPRNTMQHFLRLFRRKPFHLR
jgi:hypothetical protein